MQLARRGECAPLGFGLKAYRGLPALAFYVCRRASVFDTLPHGFARPHEATSRNSTMGGRRQLVFHHHQLCAARQKPAVPRRYWRCRARRREIQSRAIRLALSSLPAYAGPSARDHGLSKRTRNGNDRQKLEKVRCWKTWRRLATRFFRSSVARPSRTGRENELHPNESGSKRIMRASG
jgi:hypothetical protein